MADEPEHEVKWAEYPGRKCRQPITDDGLVDHFCDLPDQHPGPCCPSTLQAAITRRLAWEAAHEGWEKTVANDDPFADITATLKERG